MSDPVWLPDVLRAAGLRCEVYPGAFERGHGDFGDIWGVMIHHTGATGSPGPGPIAKHPTLGLASQLHLSRAGVYTLCGVGIAYHAGNGAWPGLPTNDANRLTIGIEAENSGTEGWSPAQYNAFVTGVAAILHELEKNANRVIGHKDWAGPSQGKWDPGGIDMPAFRRQVQAHLDRWNRPPESEDDDMTPEDRIMLRRVHDELTKSFPSRSRYAEHARPVDTLAGMLLNADARAHELAVEHAALLGNPDAVKIVRAAAARGDSKAATVVLAIDAQDVP